MTDPNAPQPVPDPAAPAGLEADLRRLHRPAERIEIPSAVDDHVAQMARWSLSRAADGEPGRDPLAPVRIGAARHAPPRLRRLAGVRWIAFSSAAAALLVIGVTFWPMLLGVPRSSRVAASKGGPVSSESAGTPSRPAVVALSEDVNDDGVVDILDSQRLSFLLSHQPSMVKPSWDFSADGAVDQDDARVIARHVVTRKERGA